MIPEEEEYVAFDKQYTAFMHFAPIFAEDLKKGLITNERVRDGVNQIRKTKRKQELQPGKLDSKSVMPGNRKNSEDGQSVGGNQVKPIDKLEKVDEQPANKEQTENRP